MNEDQLENPVLGYVVITVALVVGLLSATVFGERPEQTATAASGSNQVDSREASHLVTAKSAFTKREPPTNHPPAAAQSSLRDESDSPPRCWILGVRSIATGAGCIVTSVIPGSAAEQIGLAVGDRILTVDGQQVGWLDERLNPLHTAIDSAVSRQACLLVQRGGSGTIQPIQTRLATLFESLGH